MWSNFKSSAMVLRSVGWRRFLSPRSAKRGVSVGTGSESGGKATSRAIGGVVGVEEVAGASVGAVVFGWDGLGLPYPPLLPRDDLVVVSFMLLVKLFPLLFVGGYYQ